MSPVLVLLIAAVVAVPIFQRLGLGSVLGFLAAGAAVGPSGLALIEAVEEMRHIAEFGVVFLLFIIGIELKPRRLWRMRRHVFGLGSAQVLLTGALLALLAHLAGLRIEVAVLVGLALALSSTAFVLQILAERGELTSAHGRAAFAVLLFQDLAVVPLLALIPLLAAQPGQIGSGLGFALLEALLLLAAVIGVGRYLLRPLLRHVAESHNAEIFAASALLLVLGSAALMAHAGLSMAMGAFIAGLLIADSEYRHQVMADIQPFRGFLLGLFFMAVGMSVDFSQLGRDGALVALWLSALIAVKVLLLWLLARLFGLRGGDALAVALLLGQGGEFAFVLFGVAQQGGLMADLTYQRLIVVVALSMVATPWLARMATRALALRRELPSGLREASEIERARPETVLIAGFGRIGRRIAELLARAGVPYAAIERNPARVAAARSEGYEVFYGDASRGDVLLAAGIGSARLAIVTLDEAEAAERAVGSIRSHAPQLPIHARAVDRARCRTLATLGATHTVSENLEASLTLAAGALAAVGVGEAQVRALLDAYRDDYYREIRDVNHRG